MTVDQLPRPYQLLARLVSTLDEHGVPAEVDDTVRSAVQDLAVALWRAGMDEHRAGMGTIGSDYDAHLYCPKLHPDELTRILGVPTTPASDPAKDYGRGRTIR